VEKLENKLRKAVKREDYEEAARLRDEIEVHRHRQGAGGA
jgi:protein-arginine kinase activator protein McsA